MEKTRRIRAPIKTKAIKTPKDLTLLNIMVLSFYGVFASANKDLLTALISWNIRFNDRINNLIVGDLLHFDIFQFFLHPINLGLLR